MSSFTMTEVMIPLMGSVIIPIFGNPWGGISLPPSFPDDPTNPSSLLAMWDITGSDGVTVPDTTEGTEPPPYSEFNGRGRVWNFADGASSIEIGTYTPTIEVNDAGEKVFYEGYFTTDDVTAANGHRDLFACNVNTGVDAHLIYKSSGTDNRIGLQITTTLGSAYYLNFDTCQIDTVYKIRIYLIGLTLYYEIDGVVVAQRVLDSEPAIDFTNTFIAASPTGSAAFWLGKLWGTKLGTETFSAIGQGSTIIGNQGTLGALTTTSESDFYAEVTDGTGDSATESGMTISDGASQYYDELHTQLIPAGVFIPPLYNSNSLCSAFTVTGAQAPLQYPSPLKQPLSITSVVCCDASLADAFTPSEPVTVVSTEGTAVISSDGTTVTTAGTLFAITLSNGEILDCAEGGGSNLYSRTGNTTFAITTASEVDFWSGERPEGNYDPRVRDGFWKIDGDDANYPFPIATSTKGEPWDVFQGRVRETPEMINVDLHGLGDNFIKNDKFTSWIDPTIPDDWGLTRVLSEASDTYAKLTLDAGQTSGNLWQNCGTVMEDGKSYELVARIKNGNLSGNGIRLWYDADGTDYATDYITSTEDTVVKLTIRANSSAHIIKVDVSGSAGEYGYVDLVSVREVDVPIGFYTDQVTGYALEFDRTDLDELGVEEVENGEFVTADVSYWDAAFDATSVTVIGNGGAVCAYSGAFAVLMRRDNALSTGITSRVVIKVKDYVSGGLPVYCNNFLAFTLNSDGIYEVDIVGDGDNRLQFATDDCSLTIDSISVREVNQYQNNNKQYYWSVCNGNAVYTDQLNDGQDAEVTPWFFCDSLKGCGFALVIGSDNDERSVNGEFELWTDPTIPDGWAYNGTPDANNYVEESLSGHLRLVSDGTFISILQDSKEPGAVYEIMWGISELPVAGGIKLNGFDTVVNLTDYGIGVHTLTLSDSVNTAVQLSRLANAGPNDATLDFFSIRQVKSNTIKPAYFDGAIIDDFNWRTEDDTITVEMATGYTPTNPYMELTIAGLRTVLAYDVGSESYIATGSHVAEDLAIVTYLEANPSEVACVMMLGKFE